jgi:2-polyprenyl-6-methoxyphenol hydroxylase-like FAD-dependent oxidoreductase
MQSFRVQCCIVGGGPAGMMLGYLLGRAGVDVLVLEKHANFLRDFRGDTVHPSTLQILKELGLLEEFLQRPHSKIGALSANVMAQSFKIADFGRLPPPCNYIVLMPQWDFLDFLTEQGRHFPNLKVMMSAEVTGLLESADAGVAAADVAGSRAVCGVTGVAGGTSFEVRADLVVGSDGRASIVRERARLAVQDLGAPIDVLWFRLAKKGDDPDQVLGHLGRDKMVVTIDRGEYWQCAYVIAKGEVERVRADGIEAFRRAVAEGVPFLADRVDELKSFDDVKLLSVSVDRLTQWSRPGLLCIGDAAHAMSPVGGVGINLAIQDAVAAANALAAKLTSASVTPRDLDAVMHRRLFPVKVIQAMQVAIHTRVLKPRVAGGASAAPEPRVPWPIKLLDRIPWLRRWPAQVLGVGVRPEHVRSPLR